MPASDKWWHRQLIESMKEASRLHEQFTEALQPNVDDLDKATAIYEECCQAYDLKEITFEEFAKFGKSLRARQALTNSQQGL